MSMKKILGLSILSLALTAGLFAIANASANAAQSRSDRLAGTSMPTAGRELQTPAISRAYLHSYNLPASGIAIDGYCPVAYFAVNKPVKGKPEHASIYNGVTYHFASADAKAMFDDNPKKYIPAYGGWCAFGMAVEDKFPIDPTKFKVVDGRLLLFLNNRDVDALKLWNDGDTRELLRKADAHWKKVQG